MPHYTRQEYADLCFMTVANLGNYENRGKVIRSGDFIDGSLPENIDFIKYRQDYQKLKEAGIVVAPIQNRKPREKKIPAEKIPYEKPVKIPKPKKVKKKKVKRIPKPKPVPVVVTPVITVEPEPVPLKKTKQRPRISEPDRESTTQYQVKLDKELADLEKKTVDAKIANLKYQQMLGKNVPVDLVKNIITQLGKSFVSTFKDGAEQFIVEVGHKKSLSSVDMAALRQSLIDIINKSVVKSIEIAKKDVTKITIIEDEAEQN